MSHVARASPGSSASTAGGVGTANVASDIGGHQLAVCAGVRGGIERGARLVSYEPAAAHDGSVRGEGEPFAEVVRDEHQRGAAIATLGKGGGECRGPRLVQTSVRLVAE